VKISESRNRIEVIVALGKPVETVVVEDASSDDLRYWRDSSGVHHVPKLPVDTLIIPTELHRSSQILRLTGKGFRDISYMP